MRICGVFSRNISFLKLYGKTAMSWQTKYSMSKARYIALRAEKKNLKMANNLKKKYPTYFFKRYY